MHLIRSKTGFRFQRSGVAFPHDRWLGIASPSAEQLAEKQLEAVEISDGDIVGGHFRGLPVDDTAPIEDTADPVTDVPKAKKAKPE